MVEKEIVVVSRLLLKEISPTFGEIELFISASFLNTSEGKLRDIALKATNLLFKATVGSRSLGIISAAEGSVVKIDAWMSNKGSRESWENAIRSATKQIFNNPVAGKIEWKITSSNKDMLEIAKACGFRKEGDSQGEGLNREPLITMVLLRTEPVSLSATNATAAEIAEKDEIIAQLEKSLSAENSQRIQAENRLLLLKEKGGLSPIEEATKLKEGIAELEAANRELENKLKEQTNLLEEKTQRIAEQAKMILGLQNADLKKELPGSKREEKEENPVDTEPEFETSAPEMPANELENLISKIGFSRVLREILKAVILNPGIGYAELAKKAESAKGYVTLKVSQLTKEGLIVKRHERPLNRHITNLFPAKGVIQKLQEIAQDREKLGLPVKQPTQVQESKYGESGLNDFDVEILKLLIQKPEEGLKQQEIITETHKQLQDKSREAIQFRVNTSIRKLAAAPLQLVTNNRVGKEKIVKPEMQKIRQLPEELQKELGIKEQEPAEKTEIPVVKSEELAAKIEETTEETTKPVVKVTKHPTPFRILVAILKEYAKNNGGGIETEKLLNIALEKGVSKDEFGPAVKGLKREQVLTAWGGSTFLQINGENLAKI